MFRKYLSFIGCFIVLSLCLPVTFAEVAKKEKTQGEFAVQLCKAMGLDVPTGNYITQLEARGIAPEGGWQTDRTISNTEMASLLVKAFGLEKEVVEKITPQLEKAYRDKATVIRLEGDVNVKLTDKLNWIPAEIGMKLSQDASIKTASKSWAELRVGMVGGIKIKENSEVKLSELSSKSDGSENIILYMNIGEMLVDARGIVPGSNFQVTTPTTVAAVRGTIYNVKIVGATTQIVEAE